MRALGRVFSWRRSVAFVSSVGMLAALVPFVSLPARAAEISVPGDYDTISEAITAAGPGDVITVAPGTYSDVLTVAKSITIRGGGSSAADVVVDAKGEGSTLAVSGGAVATVENLTLTGGSGGFFGGGGVFVDGFDPGASLTMRGVRVTGNQTDASGGGINVYAGGASLLLVDSTVDANVVTEGGSGAGVFVSDGASATIWNSTVSGNSGGAGVNVRAASSADLVHVTVIGNGSGIVADPGFTTPEGVQVPAATVSVENSVSAGNGFLDCQGTFLDSSAGNHVGSVPAGCALIAEVGSGDPLLGSLDASAGPTPVHLPSSGSPLIDLEGVQCVLDSDQRGVTRPQGSGCDIGAVEVAAAASTVDVTLDSAVNNGSGTVVTGTLEPGEPGPPFLADDFETYAVGAFKVAFGPWTVTGPAGPSGAADVDIVGPGYFPDFCPGTKCVDLAGSNGSDAPSVQTTVTLPVGTHLLNFDLGGSNRGADDNEVTVTVVGPPGEIYTDVLFRAWNEPFTTETALLDVTTAGNYTLSFTTTSGASDNTGPLLDNVSIAPVPAIQFSQTESCASAATPSALGDPVASPGGAFETPIGLLDTGTGVWATATDSAGNVSPLSNCVEVVLSSGTIDVDLALRGTASNPDGRLRLQPNDGGTGGGFWTTPVRLDVDWSTGFTFQITEPVPWGGCACSETSADGLTFAIVDGIPDLLGAGGSGLGIADLSQEYVAVEFDTFDASFAYTPSADPSGNHVGIDLGDYEIGLGGPAAPVSVTSATVFPDFDNGALFHVWIDYDTGDPIDSVPAELRVFVSTSADKPATPTVGYELWLPKEAGSDVGYLGFTSSTGAARAVHDIVDWDLSGLTPANGAVEVTDITVDTTSVEAGYAVSLADIPAERLLVGADSIASSPLGAIGDLAASPLGAIPLGAIPLGAIGGDTALGQTLLSEIPIAGGWERLLAGTLYDGRPLQTLTLDEVSTAIDPVELASLQLGDVRLGDSALADLSLASLTLGDVPLNEMGLSGTESVLDIETSGGSLASIPLGAIPLGAIPLGAIGDVSGAPLGAIPLGAIPLGAIPLGAIGDLEANPLGAIPLGAIGDLAAAPTASTPLGAIPLGAIPLGAIPLGAIDIGSIPLGAIGGGCSGSVDCSFPGMSDDSTVDQYLAATGSSDFQSSPLGAIPLGAIPLGAIPLGAIPLGAIPLGAIPLGAITTATPLGAIPLGAISAAAGVDVADVCADAGSSLICNEDTSLAAYAASVESTGVSTLSSTPLGAIPLGAIPLGAIPLGAIPLGAITIAGLPLGAIELDSIDLVHSPLGAIPLGAIPLGAICGSSDPGLTLGDAAVLGDCGVATLADLGDALDGYELAHVLDHLTFGFLGQLLQFDSLTYGEIVVSILLAIDFPWEDLPLDQIETRDVACGYDRTAGGCSAGAAAPPDIVTVDVDFTVSGGSVVGDIVEVQIPDGWAYIPDSADVSYTVPVDGGSLTVVRPIPDPDIDPESGLVLFDAGLISAGDYTLGLAVAPSFEVGTGFAVTAGPGTSGSVSSGPITVTEGLEFGDVVATAQTIEDDALYIGYIQRADDEDWWDIPTPAPGYRVAVYLSNLAGDVDTFVYRPESAPLGDDGNSRSIPLSSAPVADDGFDLAGTGSQSPELLADSAVDEPGGSVLGESSTNRGTEDEFAEFFSRSRDEDGDYTIQVAGFQGATSDSPYVLRVKYKAEVPTPACTPRGLGGVGGAAPAIPSNVDTIFLVNWDRMEGLYAPTEVAALQSQLDALVTATVGGVPVNGVVIPIGSIPGVSAAFAGWDANPCDPTSANEIVDLVVSYIQGVAASRPTLRHVAIVGSDEVVPFARLEDETIVANESTYVEGFEDNALYGSQFTRHYLSDAPYGDLDPVPWLDRFAYLPDLGVGRLVETPDQIAGALSTFVDQGGVLDPQTAATAGYDFLGDGSEEVKSALGGLTDLDPTGRLLTENWTRAELADGAYGATSGEAADVIAPNAHYDHYRALPAIGNLTQDESDLFTIDDVGGLSSTDLLGRIVFTMGCHSGLSVPNLASNEVQGDWAEVYGTYRAVYVGNTGYGYGDTAAVALSEQVMANFAGNLGNGQTIGQNLSQAKQDQFGNAGLYGVYDLKAIEEATLYGLPFWRVQVPGATPVAGSGSQTGPVGVDTTTGLQAASFSTSPTFDAISTADGTYFTADGGTQFLHWRPIQPKTGLDVTQEGLVATGVVLTDLESEDVPVFDAVFGRPNTTDLVGREPEVEFEDIIFPTSFAALGTYDLLNPERTDDGPTTRQQRVNLMAGQYVGPLNIQRLFNQIDGQVYYSDDPSAVDWTPPVISLVDADVVGNQVTFLVTADDAESGLSRVVVLYRSSASGSFSDWSIVDLVPLGDGRWAGGGLFDASVTPPLDYVVQSVNGTGVVGVSTFKGEFHKADVVDPGDPDINHPPVVESVVGPVGPVPLGMSVGMSATFSDPDGLDHIAVWSWGDGTTSAGSITSDPDSGYSAFGSHIYADPGVYRVEVVIVDAGGGVGEGLFEFVVVYDPTAGFVTGGGWVHSPVGAYPADPWLAGIANFGFVSKYKKGQSVPDGNTQFQFKAAGLSFKSVSYDWLVISGHKAQYKGVGTINGSGEYGFKVFVIDGDLKGDGIDRFRIKIWDSTTGQVVYDNEVGSDESSSAEPTTAIAGGSIVIHSGDKGGGKKN